MLGRVQTAEQIFMTALDYNSDLDAEGRNQDDPVTIWFDYHKDLWRVCGGPSLRESGTTILTGHKGTGKTTKLQHWAEQFQAEGDRRNVVLRQDLSSWAAMARSTDPQSLVCAVKKHIMLDLKRQMDRSAAYEAEKCRWAYDNSQDDELYNKYADSVRSMSDNDILSNDDLRQLGTRWEKDTPDDDPERLTVAARTSGVKIILQIDNIDHLPADHVVEIANVVLGLVDPNMTLHIAVRPQSEVLIKGSLHGSEVPVSMGEIVSIHDVAIQRIKATRQYVEEKTGADGVSMDGLARRFESNLRRVVSEFSTEVMSWHNYDLRKILKFVRMLSQDVDLTGNRSARGIVYSRLIGGAGALYLEKIFTPQAATAGNSNFYFLPLRILSYMDLHGGEGYSEEDIKRHFYDNFGVSAVFTRSALVALLQENVSAGSPLIQIGGNITLTPAGKIFVKRFVFTCDYLAWMYGRTLGMSKVKDSGYRSQMKLDKSVVFLEERLLPDLLEEHPYMVEGHKPKPAEVARLQRYSESFGFGKDNWFLGALLRELEKYAEERPRIDKSDLVRVGDRIRPMLSRLNDILEQNS